MTEKENGPIGKSTTLEEMYSESTDKEIWVKLNLSDAVKKLSAVDIIEISEETVRLLNSKYNSLSETDQRIVDGIILLYDNEGLLNSGSKVKNTENADVFIKEFPNDFEPKTYWGAKRLADGYQS